MEVLQDFDDSFLEPFDPMSVLNFSLESNAQSPADIPPVLPSIDEQRTAEPSNDNPSIHVQPMHEPSIEEPSLIHQEQAQLPLPPPLPEDPVLPPLNVGRIYRTIDGATLNPETALNSNQAYLDQPHPLHLTHVPNSFQNSLLSGLSHPSQISCNQITDIARTPFDMALSLSQMPALQTAQQAKNMSSGTQALHAVQGTQLNPVQTAVSVIAPSEIEYFPQATCSPHVPASETPFNDDISIENFPELAPFPVGPYPEQPQPFEFISTESLAIPIDQSGVHRKRPIQEVENYVQRPQKRIRVPGAGNTERVGSEDDDWQTAGGGEDTTQGQGSLGQAHGTIARTVPLHQQSEDDHVIQDEAGPLEMIKDVRYIEGYAYEHVEVSNPILCEICGKGFPTQESLKRHESRSHPDSNKEEEDEEECEMCLAKLKNKVNLIRHVSKIHNGVIKETCRKCGAKFTSRFSYVTHLKSIHSQTPESVKKRASQRPRVGRVSKTDKMVKFMAFNCRTCGHTSLTRSNIERHIRLCHIKERKFECHCGKAFPTKDNLVCHQESKNCLPEESE